MNAKDKAAYERLTTPAARANWLVRAAHRDGGITATPDIDPSSLSLRWRVAVLDVALPGPFTAKTAEGAIEQGLERLRKVADTEPLCPACNGDDYGKRHHNGSFLAPEATWRECDDCGHKSEPS
jgi:hypothetical protein